MARAGVDADGLIGAIYGAALAPDQWARVLDDFGRLFRSHTGAVVLVGGPEAVRPAVFGPAGRTPSIADYRDRWAESPPRTASGHTLDILRAGARLAVGDVRSDAMLMPREELERSAFYDEHLRPHGFEHAFAAKLWDGPRGYGVLSLSRSRQSGPFSPEELARCASMQPHVQRAMAMAEQLSWSRVDGRAGVEARDGAGHPLLLADAAGACGQVNREAEDLFRREGLRLVRGRLRTPDRAADAAFAEVVGQAVRGAGPRIGGALRIPRRGRRSPLVALVTPVGAGGDWFIPNPPRALVTFFDPELRRVPSVARLRGLYGLTESEAAVARGVAKGHELADVAAELHLTVNTARQYLTRAFAKTDTARQHDLARLLAGLAATDR